MGKSQRDKGARRERQLVAMHLERGIKAVRVPLSGATRYRDNGCDLDIYVHGPEAAPWITESKARRSGEGFVTIKRWLGDADALFLVEDRCEPLVVLPWLRWIELLEGKQ